MEGREARSWASTNSSYSTTFSFHNTKEIISTLAVEVFALRIPSNQGLSFSHGMIIYTPSWSYLVENFPGCPCVPRFGSYIAENLHESACITIYQISNFHTQKPPPEKPAVVQFWRTVDPDSNRSSTDFVGSEVFAVAMALFGLALRLAPLWRWNLETLEQQALWGQRKNSEYIGRPCTAYPRP